MVFCKFKYFDMKTITSTSSMDRTNLLITLILTALLVVLFFAIPDFYPRLILFMLFSVLYVVIYGHIPTSFSLTEDSLVLKAPYKKISIRLNEISAAQYLGKGNVFSMIRTFGCSGIFGHWGYFYSPRIGKVKLYARRNNHWILIHTLHKGKYIIAPDDPSFFDELQSRLLIEKVE